jgi:hypothetical protein
MGMRTYGENSKGALMRLIVLATAVEKRLGPRRMNTIAQVAAQQGIPIEMLTQAAKEYEADVAALAGKGPHFAGKRGLPQKLLESAFKEVSGKDQALQVAQTLFAVLTSDDAPTRDEVLFVETAVGTWGVGESWRSWLNGGKVVPKPAKAGAKSKPATKPAAKKAASKKKN